jgi:hypothetical protein
MRLPHANQRGHSLRQINIRPAAEANKTETLPSQKLIARLRGAKNATGDQASDLHNADPLSGIGMFAAHGQRKRVALVVHAGLVKRRIQKLAWTVMNVGDLAVHGAPVHMHIENVQKDVMRLRGPKPSPDHDRHDIGNSNHTTVSRADNQPLFMA